MKCINLILCVMILSLGCDGQNTESPFIPKTEIKKKTEALVQSYIDLGIFSGVVIIAGQGKPFFKKAYGLADRQQGIPNTVDTRFVIGSMNKTFTHVVLLQLIEEGKLKYTDRMTDILSGFSQPDADDITIGQLIEHRSGFGDYHFKPYWDLDQSQKNIQGILPILKDMPLLFKPGEGDEYSNAGYIILGAVIEKLTGKTFGQNVKERIAEPLQLKSLVVSNVKSIPNRAIGYLKTIDGYENNEEFITEPRSDGGFYANAEDILKFYREYFYGTQLLKQETKNQDFFFRQISPIYNEHGTGIPLAGGFNGANTVHLELLADDMSIVVFANMDEPIAEKIAIGILHIMKGKEPAEPMLPAVLNVHQAYSEHGIDYVKNNFQILTQNWHDMDPKDYILNNLGYNLLFSGNVDQALEVFKLNTELFPDIGNCWDSYGEALLKKGDKKAALRMYRKALKINPDIPTAREAVEKLEN